MKNKYEIRGDVTAIFLRRKDGIVIETIIDTEDLGKIIEFPNTWFAWLAATNDYYVISKAPKENGKRKGVRLHRYILDAPDSKQVDHINHDTLDNRKTNLRAVTVSENQQNRTGARSDNNSSGIRGVHWDKRNGKWCVQIQLKGEKIYLGLHDSLDKARKVAEDAYSKMMPYSEHARELMTR